MTTKLSTFKVVLLGDGRVGKTSLVLRYVNDQFSESQTATVQAAYLSKRVNLDGALVNLAIWDTAGQERFHALGPIYYRDADAALLVYDIMDKDSFTRVKSWVKELRKMASNKNIVLAICANKIDMDRLRQVDLQDSERYADSIGAKHFVTSAKLNTGIDNVFMDIATRCLEQRNKLTSETNQATTTIGPIFSQRRSMVILDEPLPAAAASSSRCCS